MIKCYVDGSARPTNPSQYAGYAVVVVNDNEQIIKVYNKQFEEKRPILTNNQMEMKAILWSLINYGKSIEELEIYSDSAYAINSFDVWRDSWKKRGWLKGDNRPPENLELIQAYDDLINMGYKAKLIKIKGHSNYTGNIIADWLASGKMNETEIQINDNLSNYKHLKP